MSDRSRVRLIVLRALVLALLLTLFGRLWYIQVLAGSQYARAAADNNIRDIATTAPRGLILDDLGRTLAGDQEAWVVTIDRTALGRLPDRGTAVLERLGGVLHLSSAQVLDRIHTCNSRGQPAGCWNGSPYQPIPVSDKVSNGTALMLLEEHTQFPAVKVQLESVRDYPQYPAVSAAHLLGYLGPISPAELARFSAPEQAANIDDLVGRSGLEQQYNSYLAGVPGLEQETVDHLGNVTGVLQNTAPVPGDTLVTSIDTGVQRDLEHSLAQAVQNARTISRQAGGNAGGLPSTAAGVVMDARTGRIVALASYPPYAPDAFVGGISTKAYQALTAPAAGEPLYDKALQGEYLPGSTFKLITASAALSSGEASEGALYACPGSVFFHGRLFKNFESESAGAISLHDALVMSCDTVFYGFGEEQYNIDQQLVSQGRTPQEVVAHMARDYGLGAPSGIDLPGEANGSILDRVQFQALATYYQHQACLGAANSRKSPARRQADAALCHDVGANIFEPGDQLLLDIGQGGSVGVTPLQVVVAYSALVNGGTVWSPTVGEALVSPNGRIVRRIDPRVRDRVPVASSYLSYIEQGMYGVTQQQTPVRGTGTGAFAGFPFGAVDVGGKTGTADVANPGDPTDLRAPNAWFDSFSGKTGGRPELVSAIVVTNGGQGGVVSAPATRALWDGVYGLESRAHHADFPTGAPPANLPRFDPDGTVTSAPPIPAAPGHLALSPLPFALPPGTRSSGAPP
ncbi:MAG TPA: penicillin-binding transpeptidase domain-containing protein [Mycobacteriales bacterium]|nr:penicillin-binding transpeptidase domain-containing protein [Mycobacteriales bacterium]